MMIFFFPLLIAVIAYVAGWRPQFGQWILSESPAGRDGTNSAVEILRERFAGGEISREEYQRMQQDLRD